MSIIRTTKFCCDWCGFIAESSGPYYSYPTGWVGLIIVTPPEKACTAFGRDHLCPSCYEDLADARETAFTAQRFEEANQQKEEADHQRLESDVELMSRLGTDAAEWADEFCSRQRNMINGAGFLDQGTVLGWFANAIEAGRSAGYHEGWRASENDLCPDPANVDALTLEVAGAISTTPPFDGWHPFWALPAALAAVRAIGAFVPDDAEVVTAEDYLLASVDHPIDPDAWQDEDTPKPEVSDG